MKKTITKRPTKKTKPATKNAAPRMLRGRALMIRTCKADMTAHGGFLWPKSGEVSAPDWSPRKECGFGLHGLLWGRGDWSLLNHNASAVWLAVEIVESEIVDLDGKIKVPRGWVVACGKREDVEEYIATRLPAKLRPKQVKASGDYGQASASGDKGEALAGQDGEAVAGTNGWIAIVWWDGQRRRLAVGYVGETVKPLTRYRVDGAGQFVEIGPWVDPKATDA